MQLTNRTIDRETTNARRMIAASVHGQDTNRPAWVVARLAGLEPGTWCELPLTPAVMAVGGAMIGKDGLTCETLPDGWLKFARKPLVWSDVSRDAALARDRQVHFTEPAREGLGLPLVSIGPAGLGDPTSREVCPNCGGLCEWEDGLKPGEGGEPDEPVDTRDCLRCKDCMFSVRTRGPIDLFDGD